MEVALKLLLLRALLPFALELFKCQLNCFNSARAVILITQNTLQTTEGSISTGRVKAMCQSLNWKQSGVYFYPRCILILLKCENKTLHSNT